MAVLIETSVGDIVVDLYTDDRPKCSLNFLKLCKLKYYNYSLFHTVQRNFIAQTGDPTGTGKGGQSTWGVIKGEEYRYFEMETAPRLKHQKTGTLSMANNGEGHHGSQFFLTLGDHLDYLDGKHTVFGEVTEGEDVLMKISEAYCDGDGRPYQDIRIYHTVILEDPFDDPEGLPVPDRSPSPPVVITDSHRIGAEEDIDNYKGLSENQIRELIANREAKANAQILEMVGDIPDADAKPPENVLFVCKLNPVTTSEDLEIIFSRFGSIASCEVIRDQKTSDSLQYAFIEFENEDDCTQAYFKMDNVLIDDRRIHVDFSQSLAKVKGINKRKLSQQEESGRQRLDDGLVSTGKGHDDSTKYEMVFDENEGDTSHDSDSRSKREKNKQRTYEDDHLSDKDRYHRRDSSRRYSENRGESRRDKDYTSMGGTNRSRDEPSRYTRYKRSRSRSRERFHREQSKHSHHRSRRSRSRSKDRHRR